MNEVCLVESSDSSAYRDHLVIGVRNDNHYSRHRQATLFRSRDLLQDPPVTRSYWRI
jgi:hypothetical protein